MNTKLILRITLAAIAIQFSHVHAEAEGGLSLEFLSFPQQINPEPIELLISEKKTIPIKIPSHELSPVYKVTRPASIVVGITTKNEKGEPVFQVLGKVTPLASSKQIILLLRKGENNSDGFVVLPIDGELADFSGGSFLFINTSKIAVGGKIGDKIFKLNPGQRDLLKPAATHEGGGCQVTLTFQDEEEWRIFYDTRWSVNKRYRTLIFFCQDPVSGNLDVSPIMDFL